MNFINDVSIYSMMGRWDFQDDYLIRERGFYNRLNKTKATVFCKLLNNTHGLKEIIYSYLDEEPYPDCKYKYQVEYEINKQFVTRDYKDKKQYRDFKRLDKVIDISFFSDKDKDGLLKMIDQWEQVRWKRYGFNTHIGHDKNFINKVSSGVFKNKELYFYIFKHAHNIVGFSILEKIGKDKILLILKKNLLRIDGICTHNLSLYIDFMSIRDVIIRNAMNKTLVNRGCAEGSILQYKTAFWPIVRLEKKYFVTLKL